MVNPTGLINTDLMILDIVATNLNDKVFINEWKKILKIMEFHCIYKIKQYF